MMNGNMGVIGSGILNTHELKVMSFHEAMASADKKEWEVSVQQEHDPMVRNQVWDVVDKNNILKGTNIIDSMWAMKKKANGDYRACLVAHGFNETQGKSFVHHDISSPVVHNITVQIVLVFMLMGSFAAHLVDMNGAHFHWGSSSPKKRYI